MFFSSIYAKQQSVALPAAIEKALDFLKAHDFTKMEPGRYAIQVDANQATPTGTAPWEYRRAGKYALRTALIDLPGDGPTRERPEPNDAAATATVEIAPESEPSKTYTGNVLRRAAVFGARKLQSDDPTERTDDRVVEVVVSADSAPFLIGQRVLVKFMRDDAAALASR